MFAYMHALLWVSFCSLLLPSCSFQKCLYTHENIFWSFLSFYYLLSLSLIPGNNCVCTAGMLSCFFRRSRLSIVTGLLQSHLSFAKSVTVHLDLYPSTASCSSQPSPPPSICPSTSNKRKLKLRASELCLSNG